MRVKWWKPTPDWLLTTSVANIYYKCRYQQYLPSSFWYTASFHWNWVISPFWYVNSGLLVLNWFNTWLLLPSPYTSVFRLYWKITSLINAKVLFQSILPCSGSVLYTHYMIIYCNITQEDLFLSVETITMHVLAINWSSLVDSVHSSSRLAVFLTDRLLRTFPRYTYYVTVLVFVCPYLCTELAHPCRTVRFFLIATLWNDVTANVWIGVSI